MGRARDRRAAAHAPPPLPPDVLAARAHRLAALADFDVAATALQRLRSMPDVDPAELVAAEARADLGRARFWAADRIYQDLLDIAETG